MDTEKPNEAQEDAPFYMLHAGNLWLDRYAPRLRTDRPEDRREGLRNAFLTLGDLIEQYKVRLTLFSGNLIDGEAADNETLLFLSNVFSSYPECHFVIAPGTEDGYRDHGIYASGRFPRNVHIFTEPELSRFDFDELGVSVYGWGYAPERRGESLLSHRRISDKSRLNILCGSGSLGEDGIATVEEVAHFGTDYAALSDRTDFSGFALLGHTLTAQSGFFEGRGFENCGQGGVNLIAIQKQPEGGYLLSGQRVAVSTLRYEVEHLDVSADAPSDDITPLLRELIAKRGYDGKTVLKLCLVGEVTPQTCFSWPVDGTAVGLYALKVVDETLPLRAAADLTDSPSAAGRLYRMLLPTMREGTETEKIRAAAIFRVGYAALLGKNITL